MRTFFCTICLILSGTCGCNYSSAVTPLTHHVTVDVAKKSGEFPYLFRAGLFTFATIPPDYIQEKLFSDLKPGSIEIDLGGELIANSTSIADLTFLLSLLDDFLLNVNKHGGEIVFGFSRIPLWLSSNPAEKTAAMQGDETPVALVSPPKDYNQWASLVETVVSHMKKIGVTARYKIGWEPDSMIWQGTEEEFFKLYRYAVLGARRADPNARVGGPGVTEFGSHWAKPVDSGMMLEHFIQYCGKTPLPELGLKRLPIDFVAFHLFGGSPLTSYRVYSAMLRKWLKENGYGTDTELFIGEWSELPDPFSMEREGPYLASYIVASLAAMDSAGIDRQSFTSLMDQQIRSDTEFGGGLGLFTKDYIIRPSFNAFRALGMLEGKRLSAQSDDPFIPVLASSGKNSEIIVMVANYIPTQRVLARTFLDRLLEKGYRIEELRRYSRSIDTLDKILAGTIDISRYKLPNRLQTDILTIREDLLKLASEVKPRVKNNTRINLELKGLEPGSYKVRKYLIDSRHGNSFSLKEKIDDFISMKKKISKEVTGGVFAREGYRNKDLERFKEFTEAKDRYSFRKELPTADSNRIVEMFRLSVKEREKMTAIISKDVNEWREVQLTQMPEEWVLKSNQSTLSIDLEPKAVSLIIINRQ